MSRFDLQEASILLHRQVEETAKPFRIYTIAAGAGAGLTSHIWRVPGISKIFVGSSFPYDKSATIDILGYEPAHYVSRQVASGFAQQAYLRALRSSNDGDAIGVGITASVAGTRIHRGPHCAYIHVISPSRSVSVYVHLNKGIGYTDRQHDEEIINTISLALVFDIINGHNDECMSRVDLPQCYHESKEGSWRYEAWSDDLLTRPWFRADGSRQKEPMGPILMVPGSFNPLHVAHVEMATIAADMHREWGPPIYVLTLKPPHKDALTTTNALNRVQQFKGKELLFNWDDALYIQKARRWPGSAIVMGADALDRMLDPVWCPVQDMMVEFAQLNTTFIVADRTVNGKVFTLDEVLQRRSSECHVQLSLLNKWHHIKETWNISSTELREHAARK